MTTARREKAPFNGGLVGRQPGQVVVEIILVKTPREAQDLTGRMGRGQAHRREPRALVNDAGDDLPQRQCPGEVCPQGRFDAQPPSHLVYGPDSSYRPAFDDLGRVFESAQDSEIVLMLQGKANGCDFLGGAVGEVGDGSIFDLASLAVRLA